MPCCFMACTSVHLTRPEWAQAHLAAAKALADLLLQAGQEGHRGRVQADLAGEEGEAGGGNRLAVGPDAARRPPGYALHVQHPATL